MAGSSIQFQKEEGLSYTLKDRADLVKWIDKVIRKEGKKCGNLLYFFCTDKYLLKMNRKFLKHDTYTDIITFDYSEGKEVSGEIYISIERVKDNAVNYQQAFNRELKRTVIHGVLHLCGYGDKTKDQKSQMRIKEEHALGLFTEKR